MDEDEKETGADENEERNIQMVKSYGKAGNEFAENRISRETKNRDIKNRAEEIILKEIIYNNNN